MAELISHAHAKCFFAFEQLIKSLQHPGRDFQNQISIKEVRDEFDKYKIWAGNVGAAHSGKRYEISLDYRLREASFFKDQVLKLLKTLDEKLVSATALIRNERKPFEELVEDSDSEVSTSSTSEVELIKEEESDESAWELSSDSSNGSSPRARQSRYGVTENVESASSTSKAVPSKGMLHLGNAPSAELPRLVESIKFTIGCLYRIPIRKPAPLDRLKHKTSLDSSCYQHFDVLYVKDKFPELHPDATVRLGKMITRRRQILYYREAHKQSLDVSRFRPKVAAIPEAGPSTLSIESSNTSGIEAGSEATPSRVALSQAASSHFTLRSKATTVRPGDMSFTAIQEHADLSALYAPSIAESKSSMASSYTGKDLRIDVPPRPKNNNGQEMEWFECPYCFLTKNISDERKWKKHVFEDLQPYVCTFGDCDLYDHFFENKDAWYKHEAQHHRAKWFCNTESHPEYESEPDFLMHMRVDHEQIFDDMQFNLVKDVFRRPSKSVEGVCNLCARSSKHLKNHVSRHLQQIALFSLPRVNETAGSGKAERDSQSSLSGNHPGQEGKCDSSHSNSTHAENDHLISPTVGDKAYGSDTPDINDHFENVEDVPDTIDEGWDDLTDKFSKARTHTFRPLDILVFETDPLARIEIETLIRNLSCRPIHEVVQSWKPEDILAHLSSRTVDAILLGTSCPVLDASQIILHIKIGSSKYSKTKILILRTDEDNEFRTDPLLNYGGDVAWISHANLHGYESALEELCDWAPPPPGWNPVPLALGKENFFSSPLKVLVSGTRPKVFPVLEELLMQLRWVSTTTLEEGEFMSALATQYDIILVDFTNRDEYLWEEKIAKAILVTRIVHWRTPIIAVFEEAPSNRSLQGVVSLYDEFVVLGTPQTQAQLREILQIHCSWNPPLTEISSSTIKDSENAEDWDLENRLPDPEPYMCDYIRTKFHLPDVLVDRVARHMTARKAHIRLMQVETRPEFGKEKRLHLSSYLATFDDWVICHNCSQQFHRIKFPFSKCPDCSAPLVDSNISPMADTENNVYRWEFVPFQVTDLASDIHCIWCPYCNMQIEIVDDTGDNSFEELWRQHILDDLQPFVCVSEKCSLPHMRWGSMKEWMEHLRDENIDLDFNDSCAFCKNPYQGYAQHLATHLLDLTSLNVSIELVTGAELQDDEVKTNISYIEWTSGEQLRLEVSNDDAAEQIHDSFEPPTPIPDLSYWQYSHSIRAESEGKTTEKQTHSILGPYKFMYEQLENDGVIEKSNVPENRRSKIYFNFTCPVPRTFVFSLHYEGRARALLEFDFRLDELLEMQKDADEGLFLEYVQFNIPTLLFLLNKLNFIVRDNFGWAFLGGWGLHDYFLELDPEELRFYGFPVTDNSETLQQQSAEQETPAKPNQSELSVAYQADVDTYLWPLLQKQLDVLKWLLLELSADDNSQETEHLQLQFRISRLLSHIKLSEFPYLTWDTFDNVVEDHVFCSALGKGLGRSNETASETASGSAFESAFEVTLHQLLKNAKDECEDMPMFCVGDVLKDGQIERKITDRQYAFSMGWLYSYLDGEWIEEAALHPLQLVSHSRKSRSEAEIYTREAFLPYPCRLSSGCILNFESKAARSKHETWSPSKCIGKLNAQYRDRSVQLVVNSEFQRRFGPFCRHSNCTECFIDLEARNAHEKECPYGSLGDALYAAFVTFEQELAATE